MGHYNRTKQVMQANSFLTIILHPAQIIDILDNAKASYENIFVGGFSQGGCLSLHMIRSELITRLPGQLKGIFSLGSFLVKKSVVLQEERTISDEGNKLLDIPILMMHGMSDPCLVRLSGCGGDHCG